MRIVMVSNTYLPVVNGVTVSLDAWCSALRARGHEVVVWTVAEHDPGLPGVVATRGVRSAARGFPFPTSVRTPAGLLDDADIVHVHHPILLGWTALQVARRRSIPAVATAHSDYLRYLDSYAWKAARPALRSSGQTLMKSAFDSCCVVMAPSSAIARQLESWGVTAPIERIDYAFDGCSFPVVSEQEARRRLGIEDAPLALYAGRLAPEKGMTELVAEFGRVHAAIPEAILAIAGDGPSRSRVHEKVVAAGLGRVVRPLGELSHDELGLWYAAADLYVSASPDEVGPMTAIEAELCGTPVVAYRAPGFEDRVEPGQTGFLAEQSTGALAEAMIDLLSDRERAAEMGAAAADVARSRYDSARVGAQLEAVYERALHEEC